MSFRYYHLKGSNPNDQAMWSEPALLFGTIETVDGEFIRNVQGPDAVIGVYESAIDTDLEQCPLEGQIGLSSYYTRSVIFDLTGAPGSNDSKVIETVVCTQKTVDELAIIKQGETRGNNSAVKFQGREFNTDSDGSQAFKNDANSLAVYTAIVDSLPGATLIRLLGQFEQLISITVSELPGVISGCSIFDHVGADGTLYGHLQDIESLRQAGVWEDLANYDTAAGYPVAPTPP